MRLSSRKKSKVGFRTTIVSIATCTMLVGASSVMAADFGGDCCADLEERIAELEATTARKGNRTVSLTISGEVNEAVLFWDDGKQSNAYVVTNEYLQDRFRFVGEAQITKGWTAGYLLELGVRGAREDRVTQHDPDGGSSANGVVVRHSAWYINGKDFGKVSVGQTSDAADGITEINLANANQFSYTASWTNTFGDGGGGFFLRRRDGVETNLHWGSFVAQGLAQGIPGEGHRYNVAKYDSPTIAGFTLTAAWGEDTIWNVALRYRGQIDGFDLAGGVAYSQSTDQTSANRRGVGDTSEVGLSGSIMHEATGLYASGAWGRLHDAGLNALYNRDVDEDTSFYTIQAGLEQRFIPLGKTTIFGEYFNLDRGAGFSNGPNNTVSVLNVSDFGTGLDQVANSQIEGWGFGINQNINGFMDFYVGYKHAALDVITTNSTGTATAKADLDSLQTVLAGAHIKF